MKDKLKLDYYLRNLFKKWLDYILMSKNVNSVQNLFFHWFLGFSTVYVCMKMSQERPKDLN